MVRHPPAAPAPSATRDSTAKLREGEFDRRMIRAGWADSRPCIGEKADGAMIFDSLMAFRKLMAATFLMFAAAIPATTAGAQQIVVIVNGEPITALDVDQRSKLSQLSTHKAPPRQEVLDELINERLKLREAKKFGLEIPSSEVDSAFATMAGRMRLTADQLTDQLAKSGIHVATLKARIKADLTWPQLVRGRYSSSWRIGDKDILTARDSKSSGPV